MFTTKIFKTICVGVAASMGTLLFSGSTNGKGYTLPNSKIMIHQPLGGTQGQANCEMLKEIQPQGIVKFGIIPELVGRVPIVVPLTLLMRMHL